MHGPVAGLERLGAWLQVISSPSLALQALEAGFQCQPASSGDQVWYGSSMHETQKILALNDLWQSDLAWLPVCSQADLAGPVVTDAKSAFLGSLLHDALLAAQVLQYYELFISVPETIGILLGFYGYFHIISLLALTFLYRQKR